MGVKRKRRGRTRRTDELRMYLAKPLILFHPVDDPPTWSELEEAWHQMRDELMEQGRREGKTPPGFFMFEDPAGIKRWRHGYDLNLLRRYRLVRPAQREPRRGLQ